MRLENIRVAQNGFVLEDACGNLHVARTLTEAAQIAGEFPPNPSAGGYAPGSNADNLREARREAQAGKKINAIKIIRDCFVPRLGLKEAKEIVEILITDGY